MALGLLGDALIDMETWTITGEEKGAEIVLPAVPVPLYPL